jgi:hypothetical protein
MTPGSDSHRYFEELAVSHVVGGLDESEGRVFRAHLLECNECRAQVGELRAIAHDLADIERDERRVRAAKAIETKRRETDDDELDEDELPPVSRASRITFIVGLMLVIVLLAWNFTLRGTVEQLTQANRRNIEANSVLEFGDEWDITPTSNVHTSEARGTVKKLGNKLAVLVIDAEANHTYGVYIFNERNEPLLREGIVTPSEGRFLFMPDQDMSAATRVVVTDPGPGVAPSETPLGTTVIEATLPAPRA